jgi:hypothetical protein
LNVFQRLYEKVSNVSIDNYLDHIGRYQNTIMNDLQKFIEDTLYLTPPDFPACLLAMSLDCAFWSHVNSLHCGEPEPRAISYHLAYSVPHAPKVCLSFDTVPGEDAWTAFQRFKQCIREVKAAQSRLEAPLHRAKPDRMPKNLTHLRFYGHWLYQGRVGKAAQYTIGKAYYTEQGHESNYEESGCDCRGKARKGIDEAKCLLGPYITL